MPGRASSSRSLKFIGALVAVTAVIGYVVFGWRFGKSDSIIPLTIGAVCVGIVVGWKLYQRA